jgi:hypothetical protein
MRMVFTFVKVTLKQCIPKEQLLMRKMNMWLSIIKQKSKKVLLLLQELKAERDFSISLCNIEQLHCETCGAISLERVIVAILQDMMLPTLPEPGEYCKCQCPTNDYPLDLWHLGFLIMLPPQKVTACNMNNCIHPIFP